ncbi:Gfo/Idh/MocA family protein [Pseudalkalibacillus sp. Hm43]|uniref:Gfo/Idh/MocA family protein n=1 Tax=Pseudalkalibacillus sp. Hm43 TaxID=3450742 RepID=UPI003F42ACDE
MIRVALLSKWHVHAKDYAREASEIGNIQIKVVWDNDVDRGSEWANELDVRFEDNLENVLNDPDVDAVIVSTATNLHKEVILAAAKHKKHIFTEKVLAFTVEDCQEIYQAVKENHIELMVSLPRLKDDYYLYAQDVVDQGLLGDLTTIRCRVAHNGAVSQEGHPNGWLPSHFFNKEQCGGGALIDLGAHPIYLTNRLAGPVKSVMGQLQQTKGFEVDDNAVAIVEYDSGAIGILETSFISTGSPFQLELYGTEGTLLIEDRMIRLKSLQYGEDWLTPEELPRPDETPMEQWVNVIQHGVPTRILESDVMALTMVNEAAKISHEQNRRVLTKELSNTIKNA